MLEEYGTVVALEDDYAWVETRRGSACGSCDSSAGCGVGSLARFFNQKPSRIRVANTQSARVGQQVRLGLDEQALLRSSLWAYLMPLVLMFAAALGYETLAGTWLPRGDGYTALAGFAGLAAGFGWLHYRTGKIRRDPRYQPVMLECL